MEKTSSKGGRESRHAESLWAECEWVIDQNLLNYVREIGGWCLTGAFNETISGKKY